MDVYGVSAPECFRIDDLLDFSNEELFSAATAAADSGHHHNHFISSDNTSSAAGHCNAPNPNHSPDFTDDLCVPSDDVAELEWLSNFVDDSFSDFPANSLAGSVNLRPDTSYHGRSRSKRSRAAVVHKGWASSPESRTPFARKSKTNTWIDSGKKNEISSSSSSSSPSSSENSQAAARRCTHCASEKTPQWRAGPRGPKTLCNACGVRYKSGRLVPEYRPAASPTFVLTQHSNSHRKVMELRRQKEDVLRQKQQHQQEEEEEQHHHRHQLLHHNHNRNFEVC